MATQLTVNGTAGRLLAVAYNFGMAPFAVDLVDTMEEAEDVINAFLTPIMSRGMVDATKRIIWPSFVQQMLSTPDPVATCVLVAGEFTFIFHFIPDPKPKH